MDEKRMKRLKFLIDVAFFAVAGLLVFFFVKYTFFLALPFLIAFLAAMLLNPLITLLLKRFRIPRPVSSVVLVLVFFALLNFVAVRIVGFLVVQASYFTADLPALKDSIAKILESIAVHFNSLINILPTEYADTLTDALTGMLQSSSGLFANLSLSTFGTIKNFALSLPSVLIFVIATILSSIFVCTDFNGIKRFIVRQLPERPRHLLFEVKEHLQTSVFSLLRAYTVLLCITFLELSVGFMILGINYAILLALAIAIVDILPILGIGTVLIPWSLFALFGGHYKIALFVAVLYVIITVVRQILEPRIIGAHIGLNPLVTLMCIYAGFKALGIIGMFAFPITMIILKRLQETGYIKLWKNE